MRTFKRDHHTRAALFHPDSSQHQARANLHHLLALTRYLPPGQTVLDPMAGTGSAYVYADLGYPVVCGDIERHWAALLHVNRQSIQALRLFAAATPSLAAQWDAARLPLAAASVGAVVTSPPYWDMFSDWHINSNNLQAEGHPEYGIAYGITPGNIGNMHIYEDYLRAMYQVYRESYRVLQPNGIMAIILKDRIHKGRQVPIVDDTITLATSLGFKLVDRLDKLCIPSFHRNIHQQKYPDSPTVNTEPALIFERQNHQQRPAKIAFIQAPPATTGPAYQLFNKAFNHTLWADRVFILNDGGLKAYWYISNLRTPAYKGFTQRKDYAFQCVTDLVMKHGFGTGGEIELHCSQDYAPYIEQRAHTMGMTVTNPTQGLNMGQKLKWYTESKNKNGRMDRGKTAT